MFLLYSFFLTVAFILLSPLLFLKSEKYLAGFWQRLGFLPDFDAGEKPVIWLHCVSVGETQAARPLAAEIGKYFPAHQLVVSTTTKTGQKIAREVFKEQTDYVFYFPFDWKFSIRSALRRIKPEIILLMETEIWFNFIREAGISGAKIIIVNGRLSQKSANGYGWIKNTFRRVFQHVDLALMQTSADAERLSALGISGTKVRVTGNIKFDQQMSIAESRLTGEIQNRFGFKREFPLIIAASTHAPEEKLIVHAFRYLRNHSGDALPRLLLVPRHPERFDEVAQILEETGLSYTRRSDAPSERDKSAEMVLLDSIGELRSVYPLADIVFVGGSLIPHGGQNILEPALCRKAIVTGFHTENFKEIVNVFLQNRALIQIPELQDEQIPRRLADELLKLLQDESKRTELAENAFRTADEKRGATAKTISSLRQFWEENFAQENKE